MSWSLFLAEVRKGEFKLVHDHAFGHGRLNGNDDAEESDHDGYSTGFSSYCASHLECDAHSSDDDAHDHPAPLCRWQEDCPHSKCCPKLPCRFSERESREILDEEDALRCSNTEQECSNEDKNEHHDHDHDHGHDHGHNQNHCHNQNQHRHHHDHRHGHHADLAAAKQHRHVNSKNRLSPNPPSDLQGKHEPAHRSLSPKQKSHDHPHHAHHHRHHHQQQHHPHEHLNEHPPSVALDAPMEHKIELHLVGPAMQHEHRHHYGHEHALAEELGETLSKEYALRGHLAPTHSLSPPGCKRQNNSHHRSPSQQQKSQV